LSEITKHTLANGMTVLLQEVHSAPLITWVVLYRVGSRNERTGQTGVSHWVEHMMFKGTEKYPASILDREIDRLGGEWNAFTSYDYTAYYEKLPADKIDFALDLEADRMVNATFEKSEVESERTVIISERQGSENYPLYWLGEEVNAAAFRVHGYHHSIIGDLTDLQTMTRDDLYGHYRAHYMPNNAIGVAVGAFDTSEMLKKIREYYETIPAGTLPKLFSRPEPAQQGERRVTVNRPSNNAFVEISYHVPPATHRDWFAVKMLDSILTGPGGGIGNNTTRLYKALVESEIAASISGGQSDSLDPFLYSITLFLRDGRTPQEAEAAFDAVIARVLDEGVTEAELARAKKQVRAAYAYSMERSSSQAFALARAENRDSFKWVVDYPHRLEAVTLDEILDAARRYLRASNRVVGHLIPSGGQE